MSRAEDETIEDQRPGEPGALIGKLAIALAGLWVLGAFVVALGLLGVQGLAALSPIQLSAVVAAALLPALMAWFAGAAAQEGVRARAQAHRLADAADRLMNPEAGSASAARKLSQTVRSEISMLDQALERTLARLAEVESAVTRQAQTVDGMAEQAKLGAGHMISGMEREREELLKISRDLTGQAQTIGDSISRHTQAISQAARQAEAEVRAADQALDHRVTSFGAAAALITDRTQALAGAAQTSADSALRLEGALSNALEILAKATTLTDAARQSADAAAAAAHESAGALRDTTSRAIDDARRAADLIRGEAVNVEQDAAIALERLREAAEAARDAAAGARAAVEETPSRARVRTNSKSHESPSPQADWRHARDPLEGGPPQRVRRDDPSAFGERQPEQAPSREGWTWRDLLSSFDENAPEQRPHSDTRSRRAAEDAARARGEPRANATATAPLPALGTISGAGIRLDEVFSASGLDRIAQRSRSGSQSRRRAVRDAAGGAVERLAAHLSQDAAANQEAMQFLKQDGARIAELLGRGRAAMGAEATQAFLLIDSAAG